jgi:hypothetical protein
MLWSEAKPLSNLAKTFRAEVRNASRMLDEDVGCESEMLPGHPAVSPLVSG